MKKVSVSLILIILVLTTISTKVLRYTSGIAGYTGSPGEMSCNSCHGGGSIAPSSAITLSTSPTFSNNEYSPGTVYDVSLHVSAAGYSKWGFACEILNSSNLSTGTVQVIDNEVQFINARSRVNATHTGPKPGTSGATFSFQWLAPLSGEGNVTFYLAGNSVNGDHSTGGDFPLSPVSFLLNEAAAVTPTHVTTGIQSVQSISGLKLSVYPNPTIDRKVNLAYYLNKPQSILLELLDIQGNTTKVLLRETRSQGHHTHSADLKDVSLGIYFIRAVANSQKVSQKLITIQ